MKLKSAFFAILFLLFTLDTFAQDSKAVIKQQFTTYLSALINKDFKKSVEYLPEDFLKLYSKAQMIQVMNKAFNNPDFHFQIKDSEILSVGDISKTEGKYYSLLKYSNSIHMKFKNVENETEEDKKERLQILKSSLEESFGAKNVKLSEDTEVFELYSEKEVYAISFDGKSDWRFLVLDSEQLPILKKLLPAKLFNQIPKAG